MLRHLIAVSICLSSVSAFASAGDAGCGLGSLIIKENSKLSQTFAMTTNGTFSSQFFGITTGTSNCSASGWTAVDHEAQMYAESNLSNLKIDIARGSGESLTSFAQIMGCREAGVPVFSELLQSKYGQIFPNENTTAEQLVMSVRLELSRNNSVASVCSPRT
jgi:hypothetical protein